MTSNIRKILTTWLSRIVIRKLKGNKLKTFRELEKINCKLIKLKAHLQFNLTCVIYLGLNNFSIFLITSYSIFLKYYCVYDVC